jgi:trehalose-phosphatase
VGALLEAAVRALAEASSGALCVCAGKLVWELRPAGSSHNKGSALSFVLAQLLQPCRAGLLGVLALGDDLTDEDAFSSLTLEQEKAGPSRLLSSSVLVLPDASGLSRGTAAEFCCEQQGCVVELLEALAAQREQQLAAEQAAAAARGRA